MLALWLGTVQVDTFRLGKHTVVVAKSPSRAELEEFMKGQGPKPKPKAKAYLEIINENAYVPFAAGDGWLLPPAVDNSSDATTNPVLQVDTFGNLWAAVLDQTNHAVKLFWSGDDGASWNYFGNVGVSNGRVHDFGFKIDQGTNLFHFSLVYWDYWQTSGQTHGPYYCPDEGTYYTVGSYWNATTDDQNDVRVLTIEVTYSNGTPQGGTLLYDNPVEEDWLVDFPEHVYPDSYNPCYCYLYDTLLIAGVDGAALAFEREQAPNYGFLGYNAEVWRFAAYDVFYNGAMIGMNIDSTLDTALVVVSRSTDGGASWEGHTSARRLLATNSYLGLLKGAAGDADAPGVHFVVLDTSGNRAYYFGSADRGSVWRSATRTYSSKPEDDAVAQAYGSNNLIWIVSQGGSVEFNYSQDGGQTWSSFTRSGSVYGPVAVYPDGEEDADATSANFLAGIWRGGNILFVQAPVDQAGNPSAWQTPNYVDSLAIDTTHVSYPADRSQISALAFVWNGIYVPGFAWTHTQDNYFTRPARALYTSTDDGQGNDPIRLLGTLSGGRLLFSGPVLGKTLEVFDATGRLAFKAKLGSRAVELRLPEGTYFWMIGRYRGQFVVK